MNPVCSNCGYELDDNETWHGEHTIGRVYNGDGDDSVVTCPNGDCRKPFHIRCIHSIRWIQIDCNGDEI